MPTIATFVINLDSSTDRMEAISAQLQTCRLEYTRLSAVDLRQQDPHQHQEYDHQKTMSFTGRPLKGGEIGCYLSHLKAARAFLETEASFGLVLEDDASIPSDLRMQLDTLTPLLERDPDWELVNLGRHPKQFRHFFAQAGASELFKAFYFPVTTTALLWSRQGAEAFIAAHEGVYTPVDHYFRHLMCQRGTGFALKPAVITTTGADSEINAGEDKPTLVDRLTPKRANIAQTRRQIRNYFRAARHRRAYRAKA